MTGPTPDPPSSRNVTGAADPARKDPRWTVMIFMGATTIDGSESLAEAAEDDLEEIRKIGGGGRGGLNIFVQKHLDPGTDPIRYHFGVDKDGKQFEKSAPVPPEQRQ